MRIGFGDFELDEDRFLLLRAGRRVPLRPKVFDLLALLVHNRHRVVLREELVDALWGGTIVCLGSLSGLVNELRSALGERGRGPSSIRTVHGRGYQFVADVRLAGSGAASAPSATRTPRAGGGSPESDWLTARLRERGVAPLPSALADALWRHVAGDREGLEPILEWLDAGGPRPIERTPRPIERTPRPIERGSRPAVCGSGPSDAAPTERASEPLPARPVLRRVRPDAERDDARAGRG